MPVFRLKSSAFDDGQEMPQKYGQTAGNVSPPLEWDDAPPLLPDDQRYYLIVIRPALLARIREYVEATGTAVVLSV